MSTEPFSDSATAAGGSLYYRHSGKAPPVGLLLAIAGGLVTALLGGIFYALGDVYIPFIYIKFALGIGLGVLLGAVPSRLLTGGKGSK